MKRLLLSFIAGFLALGLSMGAHAAPTLGQGTDCESIAVEVSNIQCYNQGTSTPDDDTWTFDITVTDVSGSGSYWIATAPANEMGGYGTKTVWLPNPIVTYGSSITFDVYDAGNPECRVTVTVHVPEPCSLPCKLYMEIFVSECDDNGTADPSDDFYTVTANITGTQGQGWMINYKFLGGADGPVLASGTGDAFGVQLGTTFLISDGPWLAWGMLNDYYDCNLDIYVPTPEPCSEECDCNADLGPVFVESGANCQVFVGAQGSEAQCGSMGNFPLIEYTIDPGDGSGPVSSTGTVIVHTYPGNDEYEVTVTMTVTNQQNGCSITVVETGTIVVDFCEEPCDCSADLGPVFVESGANCQVFVGADGSEAQCGSMGNFPLIEYTIDPGDGSGPISSTGSVIVHTYPGNDEYEVTVTMTVTNQENGCSITVVETGTVVIDFCEECECTASLGDIILVTGAPATCEAIVGVQSSDAQCGSMGTAPIIEYSIDPGDNSGIVTGPDNVISHFYPGNGEYTVTVNMTVTHPENGCTISIQTSGKVVIDFCTEDDGGKKSGAAPDNNELGLSVFPNPSDGNLIISTALPLKESASLDVLGLDGSLIRSFNLQQAMGESSQFSWNAAGELPTGVYFFVLRTASTSNVQKVLIE